MVLPPEATDRFYRIWFALLHAVNQQLQLVPSLPAEPGTGTVPTADALQLRNALWADDALRERFVADNPAGLPPADLELVASWRYRLAGSFFIERYLKKYTVFLSATRPEHAYGVLGLVSPIEEIVGPYLPVYVEAVLLPFDGQIIYDSLLTTHAVSFGPGIRASLRTAYRDAQEREGVITTLVPPAVPATPEAARADAHQRATKVLSAFRQHLVRAGLSPRTAEQHVATIAAFTHEALLNQEPPRGVLDLSRQDLQAYLTTRGRTANRVSFRRWVRFLAETGRLDPEVATELANSLRDA
jgi:hypothetical protein